MMKRLSHKVAFVSVIVCMLCGGIFFLEPLPTLQESIELDQSFQIPTNVHDCGEIASFAKTLSDPFKHRFFETAKLKGFVRNSQGIYSAIFLDSFKGCIILTASQTIDGITILSIDGKKCKIFCGSHEKELYLQN